MKTLAAIMLAATSSFAFADEPQKDDPIIGVWRGFGWHRVVEFNPDGTFTLLPDAKTRKGEKVGTWKSVESKSVERKYETSWYQGKFIHSLTMNRAENELKGNSSGGGKVEAVKLHDAD